MEIFAQNVNHALSMALRFLAQEGSCVREDSRNGPVLVFEEPVMTYYEHPQERVLFSPLRNANPFFHLFEAIWMLAGRKDCDFICQFVKGMRQYSDDGNTLHGAYGYRWRHAFGFDQLIAIAEELKRSPSSRRCVLQMWETALPFSDLGKSFSGGKDVPCNTHAYIDVRGGKLNMTVCCRSNDLWLGCYGANAVHFSVLQEWFAAAVGLPVGVYRQFSNNLHLYTQAVSEERLNEFAQDAYKHDYYQQGLRNYSPPYPLVKYGEHPTQWLYDAQQFCVNPESGHNSGLARFFGEVAYPMWRVWTDRKEVGLPAVRRWIEQIKATDWRIAAKEWCERREAQKKEAAHVQ